MATDRAVLADGVGDLLLGQVEFVDQPAIRVRLFDRIEVFALEILDERDGEQPVVGNIADDDRDFEQAGALRRAPAAFAGDDLVAARPTLRTSIGWMMPFVRIDWASSSRRPSSMVVRGWRGFGASKSISTSVGRAARYRVARGASGMSALKPRPSGGTFLNHGDSFRPAAPRERDAREELVRERDVGFAPRDRAS